MAAHGLVVVAPALTPPVVRDVARILAEIAALRPTLDAPVALVAPVALIAPSGGRAYSQCPGPLRGAHIRKSIAGAPVEELIRPLEPILCRALGAKLPVRIQALRRA